ncbi:methyltransferase domain-containing protein [Tamlana sp. 62-3]|uniref:Methyltransferase domain-containing protein n=1 Tax=Neotamlana sargassicola TaxID=2883125 RepID=A0A9X1I6S8_9FLAO|nr:class I SAM-dependent methyltransferase [Tamlana sargassicola]MCB4808890.1 methyltransferase domain-containing protein [Tamlana sargassicola]
MYNFIKQKAKTLIPKSFLFNNELFLRSFYGYFYKGKKHQCNICQHKLKRFVPLNENDLLCPFCGSISRNRRLWNILLKENLINGTILHFSPSRSLYRMLKKDDTINYFSTDFENEFLADYQFDITKIHRPDNYFDTIICYHILEHIVDDSKAMSELYRVLKPNGTVLIQTPFKSGEIYEDASITSPEARLKHFGQEDHVRVYSVNGLKSRLENAGFKVNTLEFNTNNDDEFHGFTSPEIILKLTK